LKTAARSELSLDPAASQGAGIFHFGAGAVEGGGAVTPRDGESGVFGDVYVGGTVDAIGGWGLGEGGDGIAGIGVVGVVLGGGAAGVAVGWRRYGDSGGCQDEGEEEEAERSEEGEVRHALWSA